ncbi:MAG: carbon-nitrogen hydrolase family protein [Kiritimatiellae bacterium]|nr:carbon-nitrogen hydrolase family protein [Kiritimatiellia bacterium]
MRIGHYQCVCKQGDFEANLQTVVTGLKEAAEAGLAVVSFPESLLTGYFDKAEEARAHSFTIDGPEMKRVRAETAGFDTLFMVGFNERRGDELYNTVAVIERGKRLGHYSKIFLVHNYFTPGRELPVFRKNGLTFGVIICADGGYIEPCRILALKGARVIFAPHFNYVADPTDHYQMVRNDHVARAVENAVYFLRANNVMAPEDNGKAREGKPRYGYGDSYLIDPNGEIVAGAGLHSQYLMIYNLDLNKKHRADRRSSRSLRSAQELLGQLNEAVAQATGGGQTR